VAEASKRPAKSAGRARGGLGGGPAPAVGGAASKGRGIGRGLEAILAASPGPGGGGASVDRTGLRDLPIDQIDANPSQPRRRFEPEALQSLADSIAVQGVLQPVLVRPRPGGRFELVAGERRWRAAQLAQESTIPAIIRERDDAATLEAALVENMARADLSPVEEARACAGLVEELGLSREEVGRRVGRSRSAISNLIRLLDLPDEVLELLEDGRLSEGHGRALLLTTDHAARRRLARSAVVEGWSVRVLEDRARRIGSAPEPAAKPAKPKPSADHLAAASELADSLSSELGLDVVVEPRGSGYRLEFELDDHAAAQRLLQRLS